jgi:hypothetical protein
MGEMNDRTGKVLRTMGIVFFGLATVMNLLGGIGTSCAAFLTNQYPSFSALINENMQWLYQGLVITTVLIGLAGIWVLIELIRRRENGFRNALIVLVIGTILAGIQFYFSQQLFGKAAPANMKFFFNFIALILFLIFSIPGVRARVNYSMSEGSMDMNSAGGLAAIVMGVILLTTPVWAGPSHTYQGVNWVHLLQVELNFSGILLTGAGAFLMARAYFNLYLRDYALAYQNPPKDS